MKLRVPRDLVFVRPELQPTMSVGGLHIVHDRQHSTFRGEVLAIGDGPVTAKGVRLPHVCHVGDRILFSPDAGTELFFEKEKVIAMREQDVLAIIQE